MCMPWYSCYMCSSHIYTPIHTHKLYKDNPYLWMHILLFSREGVSQHTCICNGIRSQLLHVLETHHTHAQTAQGQPTQARVCVWASLCFHYTQVYTMVKPVTLLHMLKTHPCPHTRAVTNSTKVTHASTCLCILPASTAFCFWLNNLFSSISPRYNAYTTWNPPPSPPSTYYWGNRYSHLRRPKQALLNTPPNFYRGKTMLAFVYVETSLIFCIHNHSLTEDGNSLEKTNINFKMGNSTGQ